MKVLLAEDNTEDRLWLELLLGQWGYPTISTPDGAAAWQVLQAPDPPALVLLDWMMPRMDGLEVCRRVRKSLPHDPPYLIVVSQRNKPEDIVRALAAGADDYLTKPFDPAELLARLRVGQRTLAARRELGERLPLLEQALAEVRRMQALMPLCTSCKRIRTDKSFWVQVEEYLADHTELQFTHGICPACAALAQQTLPRRGKPPGD